MTLRDAEGLVARETGAIKRRIAELERERDALKETLANARTGRNLHALRCETAMNWNKTLRDALVDAKEAIELAHHNVALLAIDAALAAVPEVK